jgi:hypothetical protein
LLLVRQLAMEMFEAKVNQKVFPPIRRRPTAHRRSGGS